MVYFGESLLCCWEEWVFSIFSLGIIFYRCLLSPFDPYNSEVFHVSFFVWKIYLLVRLGFSQLLLIGVYCAFMWCLLYEIGYANVWCVSFRIVIASWWIVPFSIWSELLFLFWLFWLEVCFVRCEYSYSCLLIGYICLEYFFLSILSLCLSFGSYFLIQSLSLCLDGGMRPLTFRVIIERCVVIPVILLFL
jgi:hypothetical protein